MSLPTLLSQILPSQMGLVVKAYSEEHAGRIEGRGDGFRHGSRDAGTSSGTKRPSVARHKGFHVCTPKEGVTAAAGDLGVIFAAGHVSSTIAIHKAGWNGCIDSLDMFSDLIQSLREQRYLPPRA